MKSGSNKEVRGVGNDRRTSNDDDAPWPDGAQCMVYLLSGKVRYVEVLTKIIVKGTSICRN